MINREQVTDTEIERAMTLFRQAIESRIQKHGRGKWVSSHEGLGITVEEVHELTMAIHANDHKETKEEFLDVAVCGFWGSLSLCSNPIHSDNK